MSNIQIQTLSQIHIGDGVFLQKGNDFVVDSHDDDSFVYVLNIDKVASLIGTDAASVQQWTNAIEGGKAEEFVKDRLKGHSYRDVAKRRITNYATFKSGGDTLKECIHDGMGRPYIPGSSIKGAIRTAVMATLARKRVNSALATASDREGRQKIISNMEKSVLGKITKDENTDVFRHLATGDAYFEKGTEIAVRQMNLNITEKSKLKDFSKQQVVEAISSGKSSTFRLNVGKAFYDKMGMVRLDDLFRLINQHTRNLVEQEIDYWDGKGDDSADYVRSMEDVLSDINSCTAKECVLRLGQASGWRFITGAWLEATSRDVFRNEVVPLCRYRDKEFYKQYDFPKSRRIDDESFLFGFVKLTIL